MFLYCDQISVFTETAGETRLLTNENDYKQALRTGMLTDWVFTIDRVQEKGANIVPFVTPLQVRSVDPCPVPRNIFVG